MAASNYFPRIPISLEAEDGIMEFIAKFFTASDNKDKNDEWLSFYHEDATFILGSKTAQGLDELRKARLGMWEHVEERKHTVLQAFPGRFPSEGDALDLMMVGTDYKLKTGHEKTADWAGHARLQRDVKDGQKWKFLYYRVYLQP